MVEEKVKCEKQFDEFVKMTTTWVDRQKEMLEVKPTPEQIEEIMRLYAEMIKKSKEFAQCEVKS